MYKSPIELFDSPVNSVIQQMYEEKESYIYQCIADIGINIDKEELIKALQYDRDQYEQGYIDGKLSNKWISVKDRLPDEDGTYLCYCGEAFIKTIHIYSFAKNLKQVDKYDFREKKAGWYSYDSEWGFYEMSGITHWMPLPEPPKED